LHNQSLQWAVSPFFVHACLLGGLPLICGVRFSVQASTTSTLSGDSPSNPYTEVLCRKSDCQDARRKF